MDLRSLMVNVLESEGFSVISDAVPMKAVKMGEEYTVIAVRSTEEIKTAQHLEVEGRLLVIALAPDIEEFGDIFWDVGTFERLAGRAVLGSLLGEERPADIMSSFEDAFDEYREPVATENPEGTVKKDLESAFSSLLELNPFHAYSFSIESGDIRDAGIILIDAVEGGAYPAERPFSASPDMGAAAPRKEPLIDAEEAKEKMVSYLLRKHTKEVEEVREGGAVTVLEKKLIGIDRADINSAYLGMLYLPVRSVDTDEGSEAVDTSGITSFRKSY